MAGTTRIPKGL